MPDDNPFTRFFRKDEDDNPFTRFFRRDDEEEDESLFEQLNENVSQGLAEGKDFFQGLGRGLGESGYATAIGGAKLADYIPGLDTAGAVGFLEGEREELREFYGESETLGGKVAHGAGRLAGDLAQFALPGAAVGRIAGALPAASRFGALTARVAKPATRAGRFARELGFGAPISGAIAASGPEESLLGAAGALTGSERLSEAARSLPLRVGAEVLTEGLTAGLADQLLHSLGRLRAASRVDPSDLPGPPRQLRAGPSPPALQLPETAELASERGGSFLDDIKRLSPQLVESAPPPRDPRLVSGGPAGRDPRIIEGAETTIPSGVLPGEERTKLIVAVGAREEVGRALARAGLDTGVLQDWIRRLGFDPAEAIRYGEASGRPIRAGVYGDIIEPNVPIDLPGRLPDGTPTPLGYARSTAAVAGEMFQQDAQLIRHAMPVRPEAEDLVAGLTGEAERQAVRVLGLPPLGGVAVRFAEPVTPDMLADLSRYIEGELASAADEIGEGLGQRIEHLGAEITEGGGLFFANLFRDANGLASVSQMDFDRLVRDLTREYASLRGLGAPGQVRIRFRGGLLQPKDWADEFYRAVAGLEGRAAFPHGAAGRSDLFRAYRDRAVPAYRQALAPHLRSGTVRASERPTPAAGAARGLEGAADPLTTRRILGPDGTEASIPTDPITKPPPGEGQRGGASFGLVSALSGAGAGAAGGAAAGEGLSDDPLTGALLGGLAGLGLTAAGMRGYRALSRDPDGLAEALLKTVRRTAARQPRTSTGSLAEDLSRRVREMEAAKANGGATGNGKPPPVSKPRVDPASVDPDDYVRVEKFGLDPLGEEIFRDEIRRVVSETGLAPKQTVTWNQTRRAAQNIGLDPADIQRAIGKERATGAEQLAMMNAVATNTDAMSQAMKRLAGDPTLTKEATEALEGEIARRAAINDRVLARFVSAGTEAGRDLNARKILAARTLDPIVWLSQAKRAIGEELLTAEQTTEIMRLINAGDRGGLAAYVSKLRRSGWGEKLAAIRKAGLLFGLKSHGKNFISNTAFGALELVKDVPAYVADQLLRMQTAWVSGGAVNQATKGTPLTRAMWAASLEGARKGIREATDALHGIPVDDALMKWDTYRRVNFDTPWLDWYVNRVLSSYGAADRPFRGFAFGRALAEQADVIARNEGLKGAALARRVEQLRKNPTAEMVANATADAEYATFQNRGMLGSLAVAVKRAAMQESQEAGLALEMIMPFTMTPANVATRVVEYSPLGALGAVHDYVRLMKKASKGIADPALQKRAAERLSRVVVGGGPLILAGYALAESGILSGAYPDSERERSAWQLEGKMENAIRIGGKWLSIEGLSPAGNLLALGANLYSAARDPELGNLGVAAAGAASIGQTLLDQSFLRGIQEAQQAIEDPHRHAERYVSNQLTSFIPTALRQSAGIGSDVVRERDGILDEIRNDIPGLQRTLPPKVDVLGSPITRDPGVISNLLDPFYSRSSKSERNALVAEIERVGAGIPRQHRREGETPEEFRRRQVVYGREIAAQLARYVGSGEYRGLRERIARAYPHLAGGVLDEVTRIEQRERLQDLATRTERALSRMLSARAAAGAR